MAAVDVCGRCSTTLWHAADYKDTPGFGTAAVGCDYCNPDLVADRDQWKAKLAALDARTAALERRPT